jgi:DUF3072 family protein
MPDDRVSRTASSAPGGAGVEAMMTEAQAARLKRLAEQALEPEAFNPILTQAEAARRIAALEAKLRLLDGPPHTL